MKSLKKYFESRLVEKNHNLKTICLIGLFGLFIWPVSVVSAATPVDPSLSINQRCNFKADKPKCITTFNLCKGAPACVDRFDTQLAQKTSFGGNIYLYCQIQSTPFAQNCHNAVTAKCKNETVADQPECKRLEAIRLAGVANLPPHPGALAAGATSGAGSTGGTTGSAISLQEKNVKKGHPCGRDTAKTKAVQLQFDIGCKQQADNPIVDMVYALIRFLTLGVGLVLAISIIYAGIMYSTSGGNPEQTSKAKERILNAMIGLLFYLLISALANFLIPGGLFG